MDKLLMNEMEDDYDLVKEEEKELERFLTFKTEELIFGIETKYVVEIITEFNIRVVPLVPDYIKGIINLRGEVLPIIDLRIFLGKEFLEYGSTTCIIIIKKDGISLGIAVDTVLQVKDIDLLKQRPIPKSSDNKIAKGIVESDDSVVLLFDCDEIIVKAEK